MRLGERGGFGLVADDNVDVWEDLVERVLEKLRNERRRKVEDELLESS
jgi:hypothetical protein